MSEIASFFAYAPAPALQKPLVNIAYRPPQDWLPPIAIHETSERRVKQPENATMHTEHSR